MEPQYQPTWRLACEREGSTKSTVVSAEMTFKLVESMLGLSQACCGRRDASDEALEHLCIVLKLTSPRSVASFLPFGRHLVHYRPRRPTPAETFAFLLHNSSLR